MKIDTSQISLSTTGQYLENIHSRKETRLQFSRLYDDKMQGEHSETLSVFEEEKTRHHEWSETRTIDTSRIDAHPGKYGEALYRAYDYYSWQIDTLQQQNGTLYEKDAIHAREIRQQTQMQYAEYASSIAIDLTGNQMVGEDEIYLLQTTNSLSDSEEERKLSIIKRLEADTVRMEANARQVTRTIMDNSPVSDGPDSLLQNIKKMKDIINKISEKLFDLSNDAMWNNPSADPDYKKKNGSDFQNIRLDWANINPTGDDLFDRAGYTYEYQEENSFTRYEKKNINFLANGIVNTMDGQEINFSFELNLEKEVFEKSLFIKKEEGYVFIDPLVITLDGTAPQLSEAKFTFDLDADGTTEDILMLTQGSGFLCLDKNKDGIINDGRELFGPGTGNGFLELLQYDQDQNLWIDENDEVFDELAFWENDGSGNMQLTKIKDAGIGAIYLANSNTSIDVLDGENNVQARIKKTGVALNENGSVSSVMEMDWIA